MADRGRRAVVAGCCALALAGCGFRPLYGENTAGSAVTLATVRVEPIPDRIGQKMRNLLMERLSPKGPPGKPLYNLSVKLTESRDELAIRKDETATRANLTVEADFHLTAIDYPALGALSGKVQSINSYNVLQSEYATLSAENDARDRALRSLANEIRRRIAAGLRNPQLFVPPAAEKPEQRR